MIKIRNFISFRTRGSTLMKNSLLGLMLMTIYFATYAQSSCSFLDTKVTLSDKTSLCVKDVPFFNKSGLIVNDPNSTYADIAKRSSTFSIATTTEPQLCPFASQITWNFGTRENSLSALKGCEEKLQSRVSQIGKADQSVNCKCDILIDSNSTSKWNKKELDLLTQQYLTQISASNKPLAVITREKQQGQSVVIASNDRIQDIVNQQKIENERLRAEAELAKIRQKELEDLIKKTEEARNKEQENRPDQNTNKGPVRLKVEVLVIGNKSYPGKQALINSINDATAISNAFKSMGFSVTDLMDARRDQLVNALSKFNEKSALADLSIVYYAGHGGQIGGRNYIIPIDVDFYDLKKIPLEGIDFYLVAENFMQGKTKLLFFDACRNNPVTNVAGRSIYKGLAPMKPAEGTLYSFATKDGQLAEDGVGKHSPYTAALLEHLKDKNDIKTVLSNVREKVILRTKNQQQPYVYDSLSGGSLILSLIIPK